MRKSPLIANIRIAALCTLLVVPLWVFAEAPLERAATVQWMGQIESRRLDESSGLAASRRYEDILWSMNDSGSEAELFALTIRGEHVGRWSIDLPKPTDWEAMDSFQWRGKNYLLVADIGDNFAMRGSVSYTILEEPDARSMADDAILRPLISQHFVYPKGPRDSEAIAVNPARGEILVLSKRTKPPELYRLPLSLFAANETQVRTNADEPITASYVTSLQGFAAPSRAEVDLYGGIWKYLAMPTGMSIADNSLFVTTPEHGYLFDLNNLAAPPYRVMLPFAGQREAIAFAKDRSDQAYVSHERKHGLRSADIYRVDMAPLRSNQPPSNEKQ
jgi:hypothetical protein